MTALENAKKIDEFGGCTRMSAPTPSTRLPHSEITPEVRPTIIRTRMTWMAIAITLSAHRSGRAAMLPQNICTREKGPSKVSFIREIHLAFDFVSRHEQDACRISAKIFLLHEVFNTSVDKFVEKIVSSNANYTFLSILMRFALFRCKCLARGSCCAIRLATSTKNSPASDELGSKTA